MASFVYIESRPFNYGGFARYLFEDCPNLKKNSDGYARQPHTLEAVKIELGIDHLTAKGVLEKMVALGFLKPAGWHVDHYTSDDHIRWEKGWYFRLA